MASRRAFRSWFAPPHHLIALFVLVTLVPSLALVILGWKLFRDDRDNEAWLARERREQALDLVVSTLERPLAAVEQSLREAIPLDVPPGADAVLVRFSDAGVAASPAGGLPYLPVPAPLPEAPSETFAAGEDLEFHDRDPARAGAQYERLRARSPDAAVQAGALIRLARTARALGHPTRALALYERAREMTGVAVGGVPVDLLARWARCDLLATTDRTDALRDEAAGLATDLRHGRWAIAEGMFLLHLADAARWARADGALAPDARARATAAQWLWTQWKRSPQGARFAGRSAQAFDDTLVTLIWTGDSSRASALIAGSRFIEGTWLPESQAIVARQGLDIRLRGPAAGQGSDPREVRRTASESGLPWTVALTAAAGDQHSAQVERRRVLWLAGLGLLALLVLAGSGIVARAVSRELTVARLQSDFVAAVSHEFRTPLTTLRQLTELLLDRRLAEPERRDTYLQALARQTERLQRLVESLLDFGRMEAGMSPYRLAPTELGPLVRSTVDGFAGELAEGAVRISVRVDDPLPLADADPDALGNALWNLLDNAVKYSPAGSAIEVRVARRADRVAVQVEDRGIGIARDEQGDIFRKFVRGSAAIRERIKGTGIGLAIVQHVVKAHGGTIAVDSAPDRGSTFTIELPAACRPAPAEMAVDARAGGPAPDTRRS